MKKLILLTSLLWFSTSFALNSSAVSGTRKYVDFTPRTNNVNTEYLTETKACTSYSYVTNECICDKSYHLSDDGAYCIKSTPTTRFDFHLSSLCLYGQNTSQCLKETHEIIQLRDNPYTYHQYQEALDRFYEIGQQSFECTFPNIFDWKKKDCVLDRARFKDAEENCRSVYGAGAYYNIYEQQCKYYSGASLEKKIDTYSTYENTYQFSPNRPEYSKIYYKKERRLNEMYTREFNRYTGTLRESRSPSTQFLVEKNPNQWHSSSPKFKDRYRSSLLSPEMTEDIEEENMHRAAPVEIINNSDARSTEDITTLNNSCRLNYGWRAYFKPAVNACYCGKNVCDHRKENLRLK